MCYFVSEIYVMENNVDVYSLFLLNFIRIRKKKGDENIELEYL
jgi:hypothetical protein